MVHMVNFAANRRTPGHIEYLEDPVTLHTVQVKFVHDAPIFGERTAPKYGAPSVLREVEHGWEVTVPEVHMSTIVVLESKALA
jgi:hypothetical protein